MSVNCRLSVAIFVLFTAPQLSALAQPSTANRPKLPVPTTAELQKAARGVDEVFPLDTAATEAAKLKLAGEIMQTAATSEKSPAAQYVMFQRVIEISTSLGNRALADRVVQEIDSRFEIDVFALQADNLESMLKAPISVGEKRFLLRSCLQLIDKALAADSHESANAMIRSFTAIARRAREADLVKSLAERRKVAATKAREFAKVKSALTTLTKDADDADANLTAGKYYCVSKSNWDKGLPMLAKCGQEEMRDAATRDLNAPTDWRAQYALADAWWQLGDMVRGAERTALTARGGLWYSRAIESGATGLKKVRAQKRLEEVAEAVGAMTDGKKVAAPIQQRGLEKGLILHFPFDRLEADKVTDASGQGNHGKAFGEPTIEATGKVGGALVFNSGDYVSVPALGSHAAFSLALWVYYVPQMTRGYTALFHNDGGWGKPGIFHCHHAHWGRTNFAVNGAMNRLATDASARANVTATLKWKANIWQHYAFAYDTANKRGTIYIDGKVDFEGRYGEVAAADLGPGNLGAWNGSSRFFVGAMDDVRFYNRAISAEEAAALFNLGAANK